MSNEGLYWITTGDNGMPLAVPNQVWTPVPWGWPVFDPYNMHAHPTAATVTTGTNPLPGNTLDVSSTDGFTDSGYLIVKLANAWTVVAYTGRETERFTGCNVAGPDRGIATGTPLAGARVLQTQVDLGDGGVTGGWGFLYGEVCWDRNLAGTRAVRWRSVDGLWNFPCATVTAAAHGGSVPQQQQVIVGGSGGEPDADPLHGLRLEVWQDSGRTLNLVQSGIEAPQLMLFPSVAYTEEPTLG